MYLIIIKISNKMNLSLFITLKKVTFYMKNTSGKCWKRKDAIGHSNFS